MSTLRRLAPSLVLLVALVLAPALVARAGDRPTAEDPLAEDPVVDEPLAEEPVVDEPVAEEPPRPYEYPERHRKTPEERREFEERYGLEPEGPRGMIGVGGGVFEPWDGDLGGMGMIQGFAVFLDGRLRVGGEFEGRTFETEIFDVRGVDMQSYVLRPQLQVVPWPDAPIRPYVGLGLGLLINVFDEHEIEDGRPGLDLDDEVGVAGGIMGLFGLEAPLGRGLVVFAEGRAEGAEQFSSECADVVVNGFVVEVCDDVDSDQIGGATGMIGLRYRF